ncbi:MAG: hypothetical protein ACKO96_31310, partial [Flammeovirgaceae bacterium]
VTEIKVKKPKDLAKELEKPSLRGFKVQEVVDDEENSSIQFSNGQTLGLYGKINFQINTGKFIEEVAKTDKSRKFYIPNFIERTVEKTNLTRETVLKIFKGLH